MIQTSTFNILMSLGFAMFIYSVIDDRNRLYANIVAAFAAGLVFVYLGTAIAIGAVASGASASLGDLMKFIGLLMFAYTLIMAYDVVNDTITSKKQKALDAEESDENL